MAQDFLEPKPEALIVEGVETRDVRHSDDDDGGGDNDSEVVKTEAVVEQDSAEAECADVPDSVRARCEKVTVSVPSEVDPSVLVVDPGDAIRDEEITVRASTP